MKKDEKSGKIVTILIVVCIIAYLLLFYPLIVKVDKNGETTCESLLGLTVGCR